MVRDMSKFCGFAFINLSLSLSEIQQIVIPMYSWSEQRLVTIVTHCEGISPHTDSTHSAAWVPTNACQVPACCMLVCVNIMHTNGGDVNKKTKAKWKCSKPKVSSCQSFVSLLIYYLILSAEWFIMIMIIMILHFGLLTFWKSKLAFNQKKHFWFWHSWHLKHLYSH